MNTNTKTINDLTVGETLLHSIRLVNGGKVQLEFAQIIQNPTQSVNVLSLFNADDERFKSNAKPRRAWLTASPAMVKELLGIDCDTLQYEGEKNTAIVNILNPEHKGQRFNIQINDSYKAGRPQDMPKLYVKDGKKFIYVKGELPIYSTTSIVLGDAKHDVWQSDTQWTEEQYNAYQTSLSTAAVAVEITQGEEVNA